MSGSPQRRRRVARAAAPAIGLLAAGLLVWQGSTAAFNATTDNTGDAWATGNLALTNNGGAATYSGTTTALFNETNLRPGSTGQKCITVQSTGSLPGALRLYTANRSSTDPNFLTSLKLTVTAAPVTAATNVAANCTGFPGAGGTTVATNVGLGALPTTYAGATTAAALAGGTERVAFRISWTLDTTGLTPAAENALQSKTAQTDLVWEVQA